MEEISLCVLFLKLHSCIYKSKSYLKVINTIKEIADKDYHKRILGGEEKHAYNIFSLL